MGQCITTNESPVFATVFSTTAFVLKAHITFLKILLLGKTQTLIWHFVNASQKCYFGKAYPRLIRTVTVEHKIMNVKF